MSLGAGTNQRNSDSVLGVLMRRAIQAAFNARVAESARMILSGTRPGLFNMTASAYGPHERGQQQIGKSSSVLVKDGGPMPIVIAPI